jgi:DNA-binding transcriptional LysR family regulator
VVCAAPAHLARAGTPHAPADLQAHPCMSYWRERSDNAWVLQDNRSGVQQTVWVQGRYHANNPEAVAQAAVAGLGVALLPAYVCAADLAAGRLLRLLQGWTPVTKFGNQITAVAAPDRMRLLRNRALLDHLRQQLAPGN